MAILVVILAALMRLIHLNQSLWLDESIEALALMGRMGPLMQYALADFQPPLYHVIGRAWTSIAGFSEVALRMPSYFAGIGVVVYVMSIARRLAGNKAALVAGMITATNPLLIYYSQEGRTYGMTTFFITASFAYMLEWLDHPTSPRRGVKIMYSLMTVGAVWTSYLAWFAIAIQGIYLLTRRRYDIFRYTLGSAATIVLWLPLFLKSMAIGLSTTSLSPEWAQVVGGTSFKALALTWVKAVIGRISFDNKILYGLVVSVMALIHGLALSQVKQKKELFPLWIWSVGTIIVTALFSLFLPVYSYTRVLFAVPAYIIILAVGLARLPKAMTYIVIGASLLFLGIFWLTPRFHREDWRSLVKQFGTDSIYALPSINQSAPLIYYGVPKSNIREPKADVGGQVNRIVYIKYVEDVFDRQSLGPAALSKAGYTDTEAYTYPGLQVYLYENSH